MWTPDTPPDGALVDFSVAPSVVLYQYDEPLIFRAKFGMLDCLLSKFDEDDEEPASSYYLACETDDSIIDALRSGRLSVRGALDCEYSWILKVAVDGAVSSYWRVARSDLPAGCLPKSGVALFHWMPRAPDSLAQAQSLFSVKYRGDSLRADSIPLGKLKSLVDRSYTAVRELLTPVQLRNTKSSTLDFDCQLEVASLLIAVQRPVINMAAIRRNKKLDRYSDRDLFDAIVQGSLNLGGKLEEAVEASREEGLMAAFAEGNLSVVETLAEILPDEDSFVSSVEFTVAHGAEIKNVMFDRESSKKIRGGLSAIDGRVMHQTGRITGLREKSRVVQIESDRGKPISCVFTAEQYAQVLPDGKLDTTQRISVRGSLKIRPRVDLMEVERFQLLGPAVDVFG